jgi:hypothetical protein
MSVDAERWSENKVFNMLSKVFPDGAFALLAQVRNGTGYTRGTTRTADAIAVSCWPSRGLHLSGIEIKVSLSDWRHELANAAKANDIAQYCRYWYVAAPKGVVPIGEVPEKWGLIECDQKSIKIVKPAVALEEKPIDFPLLAAILRNVATSTVPKHQIDRIIADKVKERTEVIQNSCDREQARRKEMIEQFEAASGVKLSEWRASDIGQAVKDVLGGKYTNCEAMLKQIRITAKRILEVASESEVSNVN